MAGLRLLCLPRYEPNGASSRYRIYQYIPALQDMGFECSIKPLLPGWYLNVLYGRPNRLRSFRNSLLIVKAMLDRLALIMRTSGRYDVIWIQYEAFPFSPIFIEDALFSRNSHVVLDYDDAVYLSYGGLSNRLLRTVLHHKIESLMMRSNYVIAGGQHVANWASGWARNVTVIPTCVDLRKYPVSVQRVSPVNKPVIGWIGTPITSQYLKAIGPSLRMLRQRHDFTLKVIGDPVFALDGLDVQSLPWTEASEVRELRSCDIGIMPIPDDSWARGKSALKLIQYMAAGIPAVASPVGANCQVVRHGYDGLLAETERDWVENLSMLIEQPERRREIGAEGRRTVEARYSLQVNVPHVADMLRQAAR